jgi:hypothetical protein
VNVNEPEPGTLPFVTVTVLVKAVLPVHAGALDPGPYTLYVTEPPALPVAFTRVAESLAEAPTSIDVVDSVVVTDGDALTSSVSVVQSLVEPRSPASPLYAACHE